MEIIAKSGRKVNAASHAAGSAPWDKQKTPRGKPPERLETERLPQDQLVDGLDQLLRLQTGGMFFVVSDGQVPVQMRVAD